MVYVRKRKKRKGMRAAVITVAVLVLLCFILTGINDRLDPLVCDIAGPQITGYITEIVNSTVRETLSRPEYTDAEFVSISKGADGKILSISLNTITLNMIKAEISETVNNRLEELTEYYVYISLANLFDDEIVFGMLPELEMRAGILPVGGVESDYTSEFSSAGINQTRLSVSVVISVKVNAQTLITTIPVESSTTVCISDTVIVGDVPQVYLGTDR